MFWRMVGFLFTPFMLLSVVGIIVQMRKEQRISMWSPILGIVMAVLMLLVNMVVYSRVLLSEMIIFSLFLPRILITGPLLIAGLGFGLAWGQTMRLYPKGESLVGKQSILHVVFWGISLVISQAFTAFAPASWTAGGIAMMAFSVGTTVGTNLNLLLRQMRFHNLVAPMQAIKRQLDLKGPVPAPAGATAVANMPRPTGLPERMKVTLPRGLPERGKAPPPRRLPEK